MQPEQMRTEKIISFLPAVISKREERYILTIQKESRYLTKDILVYYENSNTGKILHMVATPGLRNALLGMLIWLAENGYVDFKNG